MTGVTLDFIVKIIYLNLKRDLERMPRKRSKGGWDSLLPDWGQIIAIEDCLVYSVPLVHYMKFSVCFMQTLFLYKGGRYMLQIVLKAQYNS